MVYAFILLVQYFDRFEQNIYSPNYTGTDPGGWMRWLATHHEVYSFIFFSQNYFQIQSREGKFSKFSLGHAPRPSTMLYMLSVITNYAATMQS